MLQFVELLLQWTQALHLKDCTLKIISGSNNLTWEKLKYSKSGGPKVVDFDAADKCRLYVTTMKALNCRDVIPSIAIDNFKEHYVLVFDLTSMQNASKNCPYPKLVGEPPRLWLIFNLPLEHVTGLVVLGER